MEKKIQKKLAELTGVFAAMGKNNPALNDINELNKQMKDLMKKVTEKKWNESGSIYEILQETFQKYKDQIKIINKNEKILKKAMSKLKDLYKDELAKKIKETESIKITNNAFELARNTFRSYEDSITMMKKQFEITFESLKEMKDPLKSEKPLGEKPKTKKRRS